MTEKAACDEIALRFGGFMPNAVVMGEEETAQDRRTGGTLAGVTLVVGHGRTTFAPTMPARLHCYLVF